MLLKCRLLSLQETGIVFGLPLFLVCMFVHSVLCLLLKGVHHQWKDRRHRMKESMGEGNYTEVICLLHTIQKRQKWEWVRERWTERNRGRERDRERRKERESFSSECKIALLRRACQICNVHHTKESLMLAYHSEARALFDSVVNFNQKCSVKLQTEKKTQTGSHCNNLRMLFCCSNFALVLAITITTCKSNVILRQSKKNK